MKKVTNEMVETFNKNKCTLISTTYNNSKSKLNYIAQCGHKREILYHNFKSRGQGRLCKTCTNNAIGNRKRLTYSVVKTKVENAGCKLLSTEYKNNTEYIDIIAQCGHRTSVIINQLNTKHVTCPKCSTERRVEASKYTVQDIDKLAIKANVVLDYNSFTNAKEVFTITATCGHKRKITLPNLTNSIRTNNKLLCSDCLLESTRNLYSFSYSDVKTIFKHRGCKLLTSNYINNVQPLDYIAQCGHKCNTTLQMFNRGDRTLCRKCTSKHKAEDELSSWLSTFTKVIQGSRNIIKPYEVDLYLPEFNLAIEYDGVYWHSAKFKDSKYHIMKTNMCKAEGIHLIHIFENEWIYKKDIIKSMLLHKIGRTSSKFFARNADIRVVSNKDTKVFLTTNHRQGYVTSSVNLGLYYNEELVSIMTFSKSRFGGAEYELLRFCNKLYSNTIGGASKLLKHFTKYYSKSIVTYADLRYSTGHLYNILGFKHIHNSKPNYWYFKVSDNVLESRIKYQKHKLEDILPIFDKNKTEYENMKINKYEKIWDCGNMVFVYKDE